VLSTIIESYSNVLSLSSIQAVLDLLLKVCATNLNGNNLKYIRKCLRNILEYEKNNIHMSFNEKLWKKFFENLLADYSSISEVFNEKQLIYQMLISYGKLNLSDCQMLMQSISSNNASKRTECVKTIREILLNAEGLGLDKTSQEISQIVKWVHDINNTINIQNSIQNVSPVEIELITEICAMAVINFSGENHPKSLLEIPNNAEQIEYLLYKHNIKVVAIEDYKKINSMIEKDMHNASFENSKMNCLFQSSYEELMRLFNYEILKGPICKDLLVNLRSLYKMVALLKYFIEFDIFDANNCSQCPLLKRIGLYLSHLEVSIGITFQIVRLIQFFQYGFSFN